ncbi:hypothetical protein GOBAR_AA14994 [Gossypium barbadense]|uniref:DUF4283 domain-containing protein n=1 Tax=Gossypium barbadense TaxID=3634 RepID=A0A2P5XQQ7_GOSBA|nr:hypothetical protein GOBAR_AA14994 [Gossypium barbadense]
MAVDSAPSSSMIMSWKDKLLGSGSIGANQGIAGFDEGSDGDFILLEDNVIRSTINGIPRIEFSDRVKQILYKEMELTVVLKLLGRNISYGVLFNQVSNLWKPIQPFQLMDIENGYYLAKFQNNNDYEKVLTQGPWIIFGLSGLPGFMYKKKILEVIGNTIDKVAKFYFKTDNRTRGRFARMVVFINLDKPLVSQIRVNGNIQRVEYEGLPTVCFACGKYGHETEPAFGPWMLVERRSQQKLRDLRESGSKVAGKGRLGSRFDALINEEETSGGEKRKMKEDNGGLITQSVEIEMNIPDSKDKGNFKIMSNSQNGPVKGLGIDSKAQKRTGNVVTVRMGTGAQSGQEMNSLRLKSLGKRSKNDTGFNGSMVGSHSKTSPISLGQHVCLTDDGQSASCASLNLGATDNHENGNVGKQNSTLILYRLINDQQQFHAMSNTDNSHVPFNFDLNFSNFEIGNALPNVGNFVNGVDSNLQAKNLDEIKVHFNPAFEGPVEVAVVQELRSKNLMGSLALLEENARIIMF